MHTLLITDDHPSVLRVLDFVLAGPDFRVLLAHSGAEALQVVQRERVDAALVDLHMPGMDGVTLTRALREQSASAGASIAVWIMTAAPTVAAANEAKLAGAIAVLKKPFDCDAFRTDLLQQLAAPAPPVSAPFAA